MASKTPPDILSPLHRGILATVLYSDLFDHPLTVDELHHFLLTPCSDLETLDEAVESLLGHYLSRTENFVCWRGREATIETRRQRQVLAATRWPPARRFARWLSWIPFLRMVAVCGSQAMENGNEDGDVDLFLITAPDRLWLVQAATMTLRRAGHWLGVELCPNYLMTTDALAIERRNLYTAREAMQIVPLWGAQAHQAFLAANRWIEHFLPQAQLPQAQLPQAPASDRYRFLEPRLEHWLTSRLERWLGGRFGDALDLTIHRLLLRYYQWRLRRHDWSREDIARAYRRDRQMVITGGYAGAVAQRFIDHGSRQLGDAVDSDELRRWFFGDGNPSQATTASADEAPDPLYAGLMAARYGDGR